MENKLLIDWNDFVEMHNIFNNEKQLQIHFKQLLARSVWGNEIKTEYPIRMGTTTKRADIMLLQADRPFLCIEVKKAEAQFNNESEAQLMSYMRISDAKFGMLVCDKLHLFYDDHSSDGKRFNKITEINITKDNEDAIELLQVLLDAKHDMNVLLDYCARTKVEYMQRVDDAKKSKVAHHQNNTPPRGQRLGESFDESNWDECRWVIIKTRQETIDENGSLYEAVRCAWCANIERIEKATYVLAAVEGKVVGVFKPDFWFKTTIENIEKYKCKVREPEILENRVGFVGEEAPDDIKHRYINKPIHKNQAVVVYNYDENGHLKPYDRRSRYDYKL
ncbi:MAG: type I restriction enzyme HsdR N-terminal domain-containing protein [Clostridiales Family XIII bacterium]|jgi:hypothetical protein|nr:type I restriction enzyme HsdR N-terminal domain-containing protein [Clostridiales Family XIII bacterium]